MGRFGRLQRGAKLLNDGATYHLLCPETGSCPHAILSLLPSGVRPSESLTTTHASRSMPGRSSSLPRGPRRESIGPTALGGDTPPTRSGLQVRAEQRLSCSPRGQAVHPVNLPCCALGDSAHAGTISTSVGPIDYCQSRRHALQFRWSQSGASRPARGGVLPRDGE